MTAIRQTTKRRCEYCGFEANRGLFVTPAHEVDTEDGPVLVPESAACRNRRKCTTRALRGATGGGLR